MSIRLILLLIVLSPLSWTSTTGQDLTEIKVYQFSERSSTKLEMLPTHRLDGSIMETQVEFRQGQSRIEISYDRMKPAVLFSGDVTCYVLWAVTRDNVAINLGELVVRPDKDEDQVTFLTSLRSFGLLVTAEAYYRVEQPSQLLVFQNGDADRGVPTRITFTSFAPAPRYGVESITNIRYDGDKPLELLQAERVLATADRLGAPEQAFRTFEEARLALEQATTMDRRRARKGAQDFARRSVEASNEAIRLTLRTLEAKDLEERIVRRQGEMQELERRAAEAQAKAEEIARRSEATIRDLEQDRQEAARALENARSQLQRTEAAKSNLQSTVQSLEDRERSLNTSLRDLEQQSTRLSQENALLDNRLQQALSEIADTRESTEGFIVNLPDILFAVNQAELKPEAQVVLAKLAGVLLIMRDLQLEIEGHTDSTGSPAYNQSLSRQRATSVFDFLAESGIQSARMMATGYGMDRPVGDNSTAQGRSQNRRVEILISKPG